MGIAIPWALLMFAQAYKYGIAPDPTKKAADQKSYRLPEPYRFFWGSAAMGIAGVVAMANQRLGVVMAWGFLLGALVYKYQTDKQTAQTTAANANPSAKAVGSGTMQHTGGL